LSALPRDRLNGECGNIAGLLSNSKFTLDPSLIIRGAAKDLSQFVINEVIEGKKTGFRYFRDANGRRLQNGKQSHQR
jgi:hypothetical protein